MFLYGCAFQLLYTMYTSFINTRPHTVKSWYRVVSFFLRLLISLKTCLIAMDLRSSDSQTPSASRVQTAESGEIYLSVCARMCVLTSVKGVCWRTEQRMGGRGCIIGFSAARRHNDMAIDSGMSSWERSTNGRARDCFPQPPIGWPGKAVGLQVAKWTPSKSALLYLLGGGRDGEMKC